MKFTKMHGAGNDYVYVNCFAEQVGSQGRPRIDELRGFRLPDPRGKRPATQDPSGIARPLIVFPRQDDRPA